MKPAKALDCVTLAPRLAGRRFHVLLDLDGKRPVRLRIEAKKEGSHEREHLAVIARLASLALRKGAGLDDVAAELLGTEGGPAGMVDDCDGVESATSVPDLVGQILGVFRG